MKCNHPNKKLKRAIEYLGQDCYGYSIQCKCGLLLTGFSKYQCEEELKKVRKILKKTRRRVR